MESLRELRDGKGEFWHLDWLKPNLVPRKLLSCSRKVDWIQQRLISKCTDPLEQTLLGVTDPTLVSTDDIWTDIWQTRAALDGNISVDGQWVLQLENRAEEFGPIAHIEAATLHVQASPQREMLSRQRLCDMGIPYIFPGDIDPIHIELFAGGEKALHVLHVELLKKLGDLLVNSIELDCQNIGAWNLPLIEVLPERKLTKKIQSLTKHPSRRVLRKFSNGGWGVLATYAQRIGLDPEPILERGTEMDCLFWLVLTEMIRHRPH